MFSGVSSSIAQGHLHGQCAKIGKCSHQNYPAVRAPHTLTGSIHKQYRPSKLTD